MPAVLAQHAHAVVREGISNTIRHDDGDGIPETTARSGLHNLTQRAQQAGGTCHVTRPDTGGTRLTWTAPLP